MIDKKIILRVVSNLSFTGEVISVKNNNEEGIFLKPSEESEIKIWCPKNEIKAIILPDGREVSMEVMCDEFKF